MISEFDSILVWAQGARDGMATVLPFLRKYFEGLRDQNA